MIEKLKNLYKASNKLMSHFSAKSKLITDLDNALCDIDLQDYEKPFAVISGSGGICKFGTLEKAEDYKNKLINNKSYHISVLVVDGNWYQIK